MLFVCRVCCILRGLRRGNKGRRPARAIASPSRRDGDFDAVHAVLGSFGFCTINRAELVLIALPRADDSAGFVLRTTACAAQYTEFCTMGVIQLHGFFGLGQCVAQFELWIIGQEGTGQNSGLSRAFAAHHHARGCAHHCVRRFV